MRRSTTRRRPTRSARWRCAARTRRRASRSTTARSGSATGVRATRSRGGSTAPSRHTATRTIAATRSARSAVRWRAVSSTRRCTRRRRGRLSRVRPTRKRTPGSSTSRNRVWKRLWCGSMSGRRTHRSTVSPTSPTFVVRKSRSPSTGRLSAARSRTPISISTRIGGWTVRATSTPATPTPISRRPRSTSSCLRLRCWCSSFCLTSFGHPSGRCWRPSAIMTSGRRSSATILSASRSERSLSRPWESPEAA